MQTQQSQGQNQVQGPQQGQAQISQAQVQQGQLQIQGQGGQGGQEGQGKRGSQRRRGGRRGSRGGRGGRGGLQGRGPPSERIRFYKRLQREKDQKDIPFKNVIITGPPEAGKTTIMQKLIELLDTLKGDVCYTGFKAVEIRYGIVRQGFRIIPLGDSVDAVAPWTLAHMNYTDSKFTVGKYGVDVESYDKNIPFCFQFKDSNSNLLPIIIIDEIGMMECYSDVFRRQVEKALDDPELIVIATCGQRGNRFMERIRQREDVRLYVLASVADAIREDIPQEIYSNIIDCLEQNTESSASEMKEKELESMVNASTDITKQGMEVQGQSKELDSTMKTESAEQSEAQQSGLQQQVTA